MSDETRLAFEAPEVRSKATSGSDPLDRIAVRDYTKEVEIGAFQSERGVRQRVRFNIVLEVSASAAAKFDDVDQVLSYDTITEAIEHQLSVERVNLLETLAERIAEEILINPRAVRVFVRIEKLDRIPGSLGVEIVRKRALGANVQAISEGTSVQVEELHPLVCFMPNDVLFSENFRAWLDAIDENELPAIICLEAAKTEAPVADVAAANRRIGLLAIEQNAWVLAGKDKRCVVVESRTELDWAMKNGQLSVWAPSKMVLDATDKPEFGADAPLELAAWFASEFSADHISIFGSYAKSETTEKQSVIPSPNEL